MKALIFGLLIYICVIGSFFSPSYAGDLNIAGADPISDTEMGELRGRYSQFYFTIEFSGYWSPNGSDANLTYEGNVPESNQQLGSSENPTVNTPNLSAEISSAGDDFQVKAMVGNLNGAQGAIQISLVPGNNNTVTNTMDLHLTVINVTDPSQIEEIENILSLGH